MKTIKESERFTSQIWYTDEGQILTWTESDM